MVDRAAEHPDPCPLLAPYHALSPLGSPAEQPATAIQRKGSHGGRLLSNPQHPRREDRVDTLAVLEQDRGCLA